MSDDDINILVTDIALIKKDINQIENLFGKFDSVVSQISEVLKNLAVQEAMLKNNEKRIEILEKKFVQHNKDEMDFHKEFNKRMEDFKAELNEQRDVRHKEIMDAMKSMNENFDKKFEDQNQRISKLENWKWYVLGAVALVAFILTIFPWALFFGG